MEAIFVVPTIVSPEVYDRLVPAITKIIERNIILNNASNFRTAAVRKYSNFFSTIKRESYEDELFEKTQSGGNQNQRQFKDAPTTNVSKAVKDVRDVFGPGGSKELDYKGGSTQTKVEDVEIPKGIVFFNTISTEPTYLDIPLSSRVSILGGESDRLVRIGVKCVPYRIKGVKNIVELMKNKRLMKDVDRKLLSKKNYIKKRIPFSSERSIYKGSLSGDFERDIIFTPSMEDISNPRTLKSLMNNRRPSTWSPLIILSIYDFTESELKDNLNEYNKLVQAGFGDIVIVNSIKESIHFCTQRLMACYETPLSYIKQVMNLANVIDYSEISRATRPFNSYGPIRKALMDSTNYEESLSDRSNDLINRIDSLIRD